MVSESEGGERARSELPCAGCCGATAAALALALGNVLKDFRKASISSLDLSSALKFRNSQAFLSCTSGSASKRTACRRRDRMAPAIAPVSCSSGTGTPRLAHSARRSSTCMVSQLKSCFSCMRRSSFSWQESTASPRFLHSNFNSLAPRPSQRLTSSRVSSTISLVLPPKMPLRSASACRSLSDHLFQRCSSGNDSSAALCASADFASAMMSNERPLRNSVSCSILPCSVRSAILRHDPRCERRTINFFRSHIVEFTAMVITRSSFVIACRNVTCVTCVSPSSSSSSSSPALGTFCACSAKTRWTPACFAASSSAERPPAPQRCMSAPRSSRSWQSSSSPSIAASINGVVSCESPTSGSALAFINVRTMDNLLSLQFPAISRMTSNNGVSPKWFGALSSARAFIRTFMVSNVAALSRCTGGAMMHKCSKLCPSASFTPSSGPSCLPSAV
mmetsp:Transcript_100696/g.280469  ORF Transcript_100696/g.280469 Transcript_100696/m.280469 type:complete len:449 (-) Transcript_100696:709-2055(-)